MNGADIRELRQRSGLTQREVALHLGVGVKRLREWETDKREIPLGVQYGLFTAMSKAAYEKRMASGYAVYPLEPAREHCPMVAAAEVLPDTAIVWRYMDMAKFVSLLERGALWFATAETLRHAHDPYEGEITEEDVRIHTSIFGDGNFAALWNALFNSPSGGYAVSCWTLDDDESEPLWEKFVRSGIGVAIKTTMGRLRRSFSTHPAHRMSLGVVHYLDPATHGARYRITPAGDAAYDHRNVFFWKRRPYQSEREVRALLCIRGEAGAEPLRSGIHVRCDLSNLIESVTLSPGSGVWLREDITGLLRRYSLPAHITVHHSSLDRSPARILRPDV